jgi:hypothetical protein
MAVGLALGGLPALGQLGQPALRRTETLHAGERGDRRLQVGLGILRRLTQLLAEVGRGDASQPRQLALRLEP